MCDDSKPADLSEARWDAADSAMGLPPRDAIGAALRSLNNPPSQQRPVQVIVAIAWAQENKPCAVKAEYFMAGEYNRHGCKGLLQDVQALMDRD